MGKEVLGISVLTADCVMRIDYCVRIGGILCWQHNMLRGMYKFWEGKELVGLCVDSKLC